MVKRWQVRKLLCVGLVTSFFIAACAQKEPKVEVFTLYRNVPSDETFRVHVATFDASGGKEIGSDYYNWSNMKNCERAQQMFQTQPDWKDVKFWCEKGRFKK